MEMIQIASMMIRMKQMILSKTQALMEKGRSDVCAYFPARLALTDSNGLSKVLEAVIGLVDKIPVSVAL